MQANKQIKPYTVSLSFASDEAFDILTGCKLMQMTIIEEICSQIKSQQSKCVFIPDVLARTSDLFELTEEVSSV